MSVDLTTARLTDLTAYADREVINSSAGRIIWMTVDLNYEVPGLCPSLSIRVPVDYIEGESHDSRRQRAIRAARRLIDHACAATGVTPETPPHPRPTRAGAKRPASSEPGRAA
jgi:hypothetical protein